MVGIYENKLSLFAVTQVVLSQSNFIKRAMIRLSSHAILCEEDEFNATERNSHKQSEIYKYYSNGKIFHRQKTK